MYVHMCRQMNWCEYMNEYMYERAGVYICVWLLVDREYKYTYVFICVSPYRGKEIFAWLS